MRGDTTEGKVRNNHIVYSSMGIGKTLVLNKMRTTGGFEDGITCSDIFYKNMLVVVLKIKNENKSVEIGRLQWKQ